MSSNKCGILYVVATPIGNLSDMGLRALEVLKQVNVIAAEDTRHSKRLLDHYAITTPMLSLHNYNENRRSEILLQRLLKGENIALISDAGTPLINDPGYQLVHAAHQQNIRVIPIPGPCAAITALSAAGLPTESFIFEGFLPAKINALHEKLKALATETRTLIFYETPHRLMQSIDAMLEIFGEQRLAVIGKELTKTFEIIYSASLHELKTWLEADPQRQKGEFVILLHGAEIKKAKSAEAIISLETERILNILLAELPPKQAVKLTTEITKANKRALYKKAIAKGKGQL